MNGPKVSSLRTQSGYILVYTMFLFQIIEALQRAQVDYALVGGYAVALHGAVRGTVDVDLVLNFSKRDFESAEKAFQSIGLKSRLPIDATEVFEFRKEYIENRNLIAWSFYNAANPIEVVDVVLTEDLRKIQTRTLKVGKYSLRIASIDDLIKMKLKSARPQDLADVEALKTLKKERTP